MRSHIFYSSFFISGLRTFQEWIKYRYGVFPEVGFANDPKFPEFYQKGPELVKNEGCNTTFDVNSNQLGQRRMVSKNLNNLVSLSCHILEAIFPSKS